MSGRRSLLLGGAVSGLLLAAPLRALAGEAGSGADLAAAGAAIEAFHAAAARADETAYFALMAPNFVFLGTDASERWEKEAFRAFAHPYSAPGKGWTFTPRERHLEASRAGETIWFDERLQSESYGECRGSGVLERQPDGAWRLTQYHLTIPIPNDLAKEVVKRIREAGKEPAE